MKVTLVRHGQSKGNLDRFHPNFHTPLSDYGHVQARKVMERLNSNSFDGIFSSPIYRALQTAEYLSENFNLPITKTELLAEFREPSEFDGKNYGDKFVKEAKAKMIDHIDDHDYHFSDEENYFEFIDRGRELLAFFEKLPFENVLAVSHGFLISMVTLLVVLDGNINPKILADGLMRMHSYNTAISVIEHVDGMWRLYSFGDHTHLLED